MVEIPSKHISKLDLSRKGLTNFPEEVLYLKNLRKLNLSHNKIKKIPKEIEELRNLEVLDISNNDINNFYSKICSLKKLKVLNLNNNRIKSIPIQIENLESLKNLQIAKNNLTSLPKSFSNLKNLQKLNISNNYIQNFPLEILSVQSITHLWLNNLILNSFPHKDILSNFKNIEALYCFGALTLKSQKSIDAKYFKLSHLKGNCLNGLIEINRAINEHKTVEKKPKLSTDITINKNKIFISYSHIDSAWLKKVQTNLKVLMHNDKSFDLWDDTRIKAGDNWKIEIANALKDAGIAILIISTDFLASDFIRNDELPTLLRNAKEHGTRILPLIVRPCLFTKDKNLSEFQAVNSPDKPLSTLTESQQENELVRLALNVSELLDEN